MVILGEVVDDLKKTENNKSMQHAFKRRLGDNGQNKDGNVDEVGELVKGQLSRTLTRCC